jgi:hypothetical protein
MATLHPRMFISQATLEAWIEAGEAELLDCAVRLTQLARTYELEAALRFEASMPEDAAPELIGRVLPERRLAELGGELLGESVLLGEAAFVVEHGWIGVLQPPAPTG